MIEIMEQAALAAGQVVKNYFRGNFKISDKTSHKNIVTVADIESQEKIQETIVQNLEKQGVPTEEIGFIGEEDLNIEGRHRFIIDPLDGTSNFASGVDFFSISIAHVLENQIQAGVIFEPIEGVLYFARADEGSFIKRANGEIKPLQILKKPLRDCIVDVAISVGDEKSAGMMDIIKVLSPHTRKFRAFGSVSLNLAMTAESIFDLSLRRKSYIWDIAAAYLIIKEAGGTMIDFQGNRLALEINNRDKSYEFIAGHPDSVSAILKIINNDRK